MKKLVIILALFINGCGWACFTDGPGCYAANDAVYSMYEAVHAPIPWAAQAPGDCWIHVSCIPEFETRPGSCATWAMYFPPTTVPCTVINPNMIQCRGPLY